MYANINKNGFLVKCTDGVKGLLELPDKSIKLLYGSPPYPNADRDYGIWKSVDYIDKISPFIDASIRKLKEDGFIVINVKANREKSTTTRSSKRSLVVERLAILLEEQWGLHCVDIEIWVKENPVPTGLRVACQDAYEQNLWFSVSPKWTVNIDAIRRPYESHSVKTYEEYEYKPRSNGNTYVRKNKRIEPNPLGALPKNIISGGVSAKIGSHQATQPLYLPEKYIKATTEEGDLVVDPWMGSGTTGYAALLLKRKFVGFDINESYVEDAKGTFLAIKKG
ncbi:DNA methylase [Clostridium sp. 7_3_54FAA]|nr:DNA methylase [Clostridium sp. 7_3_54FAA]DAE70516.1 MAG TPA: adenine-specific methyltransferase [Caudoviricetes sp.]